MVQDEETVKLIERLNKFNLETMFDLAPMQKDEDRIDSQFRKYFDEFKKDLAPWMELHIKISKTLQNQSLPFDMGKD